jgi:uncharacterized damage-inducible protein DinB
MNAAAQPERQANEKQQLLARLKQSRERYLSVLSQATEQLCQIHPEEGAWSVLECAEHVSGSERGMLHLLFDRKPSESEPDWQKDAAILRMADAGNGKAVAPEQSRPRGHFATLDEARAAFIKARERTMEFVEQNDEDLRRFTVAHPLGTVDAYQLLLIMALHAERHAGQIERIMSSTAYQAAAQK